MRCVLPKLTLAAILGIATLSSPGRILYDSELDREYEEVETEDFPKPSTLALLTAGAVGAGAYALRKRIR